MSSVRAEDVTKDYRLGRTTTFIFSTHDPGVMGRAHRVLRLADGRLEA